MTELPAGAEALFFAGNRHLADGDAARAEACFRDALRLAPEFAEAHANLGWVHARAGLPVEAEIRYRQSIACNPEIGEVRLNLGALLAGQKRFAAAEAAYRRAIALLPAAAAPWSNLGALQACQKLEIEAEASYRRAIALDADYRLAYFNFSYLLLRQGRYEEGWRCLEARPWYERLENHLDCPRWQGEALASKSLLIGFEAGHGDMIQFCRYAALLKARGAAQITIICQPALKTLFLTLAAVDRVIALGEALPEAVWDYWTPPLSIPFHCQTRIDSIPASLPYLYADPQKVARWAAPLHVAERELRVGLVWKGNPHFENDADRSLPGLQTLSPLGGLAGVRYFSLQKGPGEDEAAGAPDGLAVVNLGPQICDFSDTAAIIAQLDLVICVDTAVGHLAGAMGKCCWLLLPDYKTDWRWLAGRSDSPWYPNVMRLFRQPRSGDWVPVIAEVRAALQRLTQERRRALAA
jgi:Tfp pilus assembly protein PilF